jgi:hypothetical protein
MSRMPGQDPHDAELERLLAKAGRPDASPAFKTRLKDQFLSPAGAVPDALPIETVSRKMVPHRTRLFPFVWPFVLAASVAFILHYVLSRDANVRWHVVGTDGGGEYVVDGRRMHASETATLHDAVQTAREIETFDAGLRLRLKDDLVLELGAEDARLAAQLPGGARLFDLRQRGLAAHHDRTEFPGKSPARDDGRHGDGGRGHHVRTRRRSLGTCLCCIDGTVKCDARDHARNAADGRRSHVFRVPHRQEAAVGRGRPQHVEPLEKLKSFAAAVWKKK